MRKRRRKKKRRLRFKYRNSPVPSIEELLTGLGLDPDEATLEDLFSAVEGLTEPPSEVTSDVQRLAKQLSPDKSPELIPIKTASWAVKNECFAAVEEKVKRHGGTLVYGWDIAEWPNIKLEAEFHAVWRSPAGSLIDVSCRSEEHAMFLVDPKREYSGKSIPNHFHPLCKSDVVEEWFALHEEKMAIEIRHTQDGLFNATACAEAGQWERLQQLDRYKINQLLPLMLKLHFEKNGTVEP